MKRALRYSFNMLLILLLIVPLGLLAFRYIFLMPQKSRLYEPKSFPEEQRYLTQVIRTLSDGIGERHYLAHAKLQQTSAYLMKELVDLGYGIHKQTYQTEGLNFENIEVERKGTTRRNEIIVVGAHYDTVLGSPGANDNGTGVAATLSLAKHFRRIFPQRTLRFVFFPNEEQPFANTPGRGSYVYAKRSRQRNEAITCMLSLETMGYYSQEQHSQRYPFPLSYVFPNQGNFIGFVGDMGSAKWVARTTREFRRHSKFPSQGAALPRFLPGVGWSDHASFWKFGYRAIMITDTAPFRYPHYHRESDTLDKIDMKRFTEVVITLRKVVQDLTNRL